MSKAHQSIALLAMICFYSFDCSKTPVGPGSAGTVTDIDGNVYKIVTIGSQVWTNENLRTTRYNDGTPIFWDSSDMWSSSTTPRFCFWENTKNADTIRKFGALYNWYAVATKRLAPDGWHVPTDEEWQIMQNYLIAHGYNWDGETTGNKIAKALAAKTDWDTLMYPGAIGSDLTKNNSSGFSALPGGGRCELYNFFVFGYEGFWWSTSEYSPDAAYLYALDNSKDSLDRGFYYKYDAYSVRLVKN